MQRPFSLFCLACLSISFVGCTFLLTSYAPWIWFFFCSFHVVAFYPKFLSWHVTEYHFWLSGDHCEKCLVGYYGDATQATPQACRPCSCYGGHDSCNLTADGSFICNCAPGYEGRRCEMCSDGYFGTPTVRMNFLNLLCHLKFSCDSQIHVSWLSIAKKSSEKNCSTREVLIRLVLSGFWESPLHLCLLFQSVA